MKLKALVVAIAIFLSTAAIAGKVNDGGPSGMAGGVSNIENQTLSYENTSAGKARAEWSKGRVIKKGESVQCKVEALNRVGTPADC